MTAITLKRINQARNMSRFYRLDVQPTLFGVWSLIREWGGWGGPAGCVRRRFTAETRRTLRRRRKLRKGYR
jgi:predicted DNA-binding WGR domain protein